ncbi:MAG: phosphatase PAP2 family protein [Actinomycetota bacterium]|jgi:undecaprenyl-diphosphatase|nr:phosphatase PAP2 family protein [Actinomycetota bacterium]
MYVSRGEARRRGADWAPSAAAAVLVVVIWTQIRSGDIPAVDRWVRSEVADVQNPALLAASEAAKYVGTWTWVAPLVLAVAGFVAMVRATWRPVVEAGLSVMGVAAATLVLKAVVARAGPHGVGPPAVDGSWPSGHALTVVVATLVIVGLLGGPGGGSRLVIGLAALPTLLVGFALVYGGHHWLTDVVVAVPLGYLIVRVASQAASIFVHDDAGGPNHLLMRHEAVAP